MKVRGDKAQQTDGTQIVFMASGERRSLAIMGSMWATLAVAVGWGAENSSGQHSRSGTRECCQGTLEFRKRPFKMTDASVSTRLLPSVLDYYEFREREV